MSRPKLPDDVSCGQLAENGPSIARVPSGQAGSCNGCLKYSPYVWELRLRGIKVRLCDNCFDSVTVQRENYPR